MDYAKEMPLAGEFTSDSGRKVTVRSATFSQVAALATAGDSAATVKASKALVDSCASVEGLDPALAPSDALTVRDCQKIVKMAQGDGADFD